MKAPRVRRVGHTYSPLALAPIMFGTNFAVGYELSLLPPGEGTHRKRFVRIDTVSFVRYTAIHRRVDGLTRCRLLRLLRTRGRRDFLKRLNDAFSC